MKRYNKLECICGNTNNVKNVTSSPHVASITFDIFLFFVFFLCR